MKIDLPVLIAFDCPGFDRADIERAAGKIVCTLRYDTEGDGTDAVLFGQYPPNEKPVWFSGREHVPQGEPAQALLAFIPAGTDAKISVKAARNPEEYMAQTGEGRPQ